MFKISSDQMKVFQPDAETAFVRRVMDYLKKNHAETIVNLTHDKFETGELPDEILEKLVQDGIRRGGDYLSGNYKEAETQINQVLENYRLNSNPKYISYATALTLQGLILYKLGRGGEAEKVLREALQLRTENLPPKHFLTALTKGALGEVLTTKKNMTKPKRF